MQSARYRRNYKRTRAIWTALVKEAYARPLPDGSQAVWACLRRAFPNALHDKQQWEGAIANTGLLYMAGSETTANAIAFTLAALALDPDSLKQLEQVQLALVCTCCAGKHMPLFALESFCSFVLSLETTKESNRSEIPPFQRHP